MRASSGDLKSSLSLSEHDEQTSRMKAVNNSGSIKHLSCFDEKVFFLIDDMDRSYFSDCKDMIFCSKY